MEEGEGEEVREGRRRFRMGIEIGERGRKDLEKEREKDRRKRKRQKKKLDWQEKRIEGGRMSGVG